MALRGTCHGMMDETVKRPTSVVTLTPTISVHTLMPTPTAVLRASLEHHNDVFESLLKLIPAQFYIVNDEIVDQAWQIPIPSL